MERAIDTEPQLLTTWSPASPIAFAIGWNVPLAVRIVNNYARIQSLTPLTSVWTAQRHLEDAWKLPVPSLMLPVALLAFVLQILLLQTY